MKLNYRILIGIVCLGAAGLFCRTALPQESSASAWCKQEYARLEAEKAQFDSAAHRHSANRPASEDDQAGVHAWNEEEMRLRAWRDSLRAKISAFHSKCGE
jgi:hypothetical protein